MGTQQPGLASNQSVYGRFIFFLLLMFMMPIASAEDSDQICQISAIYKAFGESETPVDQVQLSDIQNKLNISGYGKLDRDGRLGPATLGALERLCVDYKLVSAENLVTRLISLLEMTAMVAQKYPDWRKLISSNDFNDWLKQQLKEEQEKISNTLDSGPAEQVIAILDAYPGNKPEKSPAPAKPAAKARSADVSGPAVFYRWQPDEEESEGDEGDSGQGEEDVQLPDDIVNGLKAIEGVAYPNEFLFKRALARLFTASECDLWCQNQILQQARNGPVDELKQIQLRGGDCGCSQDFSSLVYGFYPFWMANDEVQQVDFSLFDRIGFYALTLNEAGIIEDHLQWSDTGNAAAFISKAHKFRVEVDLTIYASAWQQWKDKEIYTAARSVAKAVKQKFHYSHTSGLRAIFPFLDDTSSVTADGVTLYFDITDTSGSGKKIDSFSLSKKIVSIVTRVAKALDEAGADARINIMLGLDMNNDEKNPQFRELACILLDDSEDKHEACNKMDEKDSHVKIENIFIHLQEPTTDSKKILRRKIEDDFRGHHRKTVLRKLVPIISPAGSDEDPRGAFYQFTDDLIYLQDNFAGVGLWPLPLASDAEMTTIEEKIVELFKETNSSNHLGGMIDTYAPWLCEFACPNRWLFRISFDLLAGLLVIYALLAIWICRLRGLFKQYLLYFLAVGLAAVMVFLISLVCDPFWNERADSVVITVFLVALVAIIWRSVSKATEPPLP